MDIWILSSGRPLRQTTFDNLPKSLQERAKLVVPTSESKAYKKYPHIGIDRRGIGLSRQWCVENSVGKMVMLDDDLVFAIRRKDNPTRFHNPAEKDIENLFSEIEMLLDNHAHVGVATREGGNYDTEDHKFNTRMLRVLAYDTQVLKKEDIRFDRLAIMEDFDVTLQLLRKGYQNVIINHMVQNQNGSNLAGGCSQYRTKELQEEAAQELARKHFPYVSVVKKQTKTAWGGGERTDVKIYWKKAYNDVR